MRVSITVRPHGCFNRQRFGGASAEAMMQKYQSALDDWFSGKQPEIESACCPVEKNAPKLVSPFAKWLKAKTPLVRWGANVLDWFWWFYKSIEQDARRLISG